MGNILQTLFEALAGLLKRLLPGFDILGEEIQRTGDDNPEAACEDWIYISLTPAGNETYGSWQTERRIICDIAAHTRDESNTAYRSMSGRLDSAIRPVLRFGGRAITVPDLSCRVVDRVLHCTFTLTFFEGQEPDNGFPVMEELDTNLERNEAYGAGNP